MLLLSVSLGVPPNLSDLPFVTETFLPLILTVSLVFFLFAFLLVFQIVFFYRTFFRLKKNYQEIAIEEIRMFHLFCAEEKTCVDRDLRYRIVSDNEVELLTYLRDSYLRCAYYDMMTNLKRGSSLIVFDNLTLISLVMLIINGVLSYFNGGVQ